MPAVPVPLSAGLLDRGDRFRGDAAWQAASARDAGTRTVLVGVGGGIVLDGDELALAGPEALADVPVPTFLGVRPDGVALFAARAGTDEGAVDPRDALHRLSPEDAATAAQAVALLRWQDAHRFCGVCGSPTDVVAAGHQRHCPTCGARHFPRTDPVATMLVVAGDRCLLSRRRGGREKVWAALAGFVDAGESAEAAVARETLEEVGLRVTDVTYVGSQPWPFPFQLMLGYRATVDPAEPVLDGELLDARWFDRSALRAAVDADEVRLPPPSTIGCHLISGWLAERG